jgi:hypothetical protein
MTATFALGLVGVRPGFNSNSFMGPPPLFSSTLHKVCLTLLIMPLTLDIVIVLDALADLAQSQRGHGAPSASRAP